MGILIDIENEEDKSVYADAARDIESIIHNSEDFSYIKAPQKEFLKESKKIYSVESSLPKTPTSQPRDFSKSAYKTTKELSEITGISSRKINSSLIKKGLMTKKD